LKDKESFDSSLIKKANSYLTDEPTIHSWTITPVILSLSKNCSNRHIEINIYEFVDVHEYIWTNVHGYTNIFVYIYNTLIDYDACDLPYLKSDMVYFE
jgi:hypothetical protein